MCCACGCSLFLSHSAVLSFLILLLFFFSSSSRSPSTENLPPGAAAPGRRYTRPTPRRAPRSLSPSPPSLRPSRSRRPPRPSARAAPATPATTPSPGLGTRAPPRHVPRTRTMCEQTVPMRPFKTLFVPLVFPRIAPSPLSACPACFPDALTPLARSTVAGWRTFGEGGAAGSAVALVDTHAADWAAANDSDATAASRGATVLQVSPLRPGRGVAASQDAQNTCSTCTVVVEYILKLRSSIGQSDRHTRALMAIDPRTNHVYHFRVEACAWWQPLAPSKQASLRKRPAGPGNSESPGRRD